MAIEKIEDRVGRLVLEYAQSAPLHQPLGARASLRHDLAIESLALVSLALRLGDELDVDLVELGIDLSKLKTFGDVIELAKTIERLKSLPNAKGGPREVRGREQG